MSDPSTEASPSEEAPQVQIFPARFESLDEVRTFVGKAAENCGLGEAAVYQVQLAVDEAFTNIVEHAYGGESDEKVECTCRIGADRLTVVLRDCGNPFNPEEVPDPNLEASLEDREEGGLGLFFMRQLMDDVTFAFMPDKGPKRGCNVLTMVKLKE